VKPGNILFAADGSVRLTDLGVAAAGNPPRGLPAGWVEEKVGTLGYTAPALLRDAAIATVAVDDYGLAATLYEALTGFLPYDFHPGESEADLERRISGGEPPIPITQRRGEVTPDLAAWIMERLVGV
jgi:serine/threonine protein kinase